MFIKRKPRVDHDLLLRALDVLVDAARARETVTYGELAWAIEYGGPIRAIGSMVLAPLYYYVCFPNDLPDLSPLVVRKDTRRPGVGYYDSLGGREDAAYWRRQLAMAYNFVWPSGRPKVLGGSSDLLLEGSPRKASVHVR